MSKNLNPFFSLIIPIYNVEKYIIRCIESILCQDFDDSFEVLLVDDGSPDNSIELVNKKFNDSRIKILSKENGGLSDARNFGLKYAKGQYLWYIDSDDYIKDNTALQKIKNAIENNKSQVDIIVFNTEVIFEDSMRESFILENVKENTKILSGFDYVEKYNTFPYNAWTQCYKKNFLIDNNFLFPKDLFYEDLNLNLDIYSTSKKIIGIKDVLYVYCRRNNSITSSNISNNHLFSQISSFYKIYNFYKSNKLPQKYLKERVNIEYERTKGHYQSNNSLTLEMKNQLNKINIPTEKSDKLFSKFEKIIFNKYPIFVLNNQKLFKNLLRIEKKFLRIINK